MFAYFCHCYYNAHGMLCSHKQISSLTEYFPKNLSTEFHYLVFFIFGSLYFQRQEYRGLLRTQRSIQIRLFAIFSEKALSSVSKYASSENQTSTYAVTNTHLFHLKHDLTVAHRCHGKTKKLTAKQKAMTKQK